LASLLAHDGRNAVRTVHQVATTRHLLYLIDKNYAFALEAFHHVPIVNNLVKHVERRAKEFDRPV
jgi:hypothetical protein